MVPQNWNFSTESKINTHTEKSYRNYRKYKFPNRKLDVNGLSSRIYYWEIQK